MTTSASRVSRGTARMLAMRASEIAQGGEPIGWKAGFGSPAAMESLGTDGPLVGYLTRDRLLPSEATVSVAGWINPMLEAEVAAHLSHDVEPGCSSSEALAAVGGWSAAIELADVSFPPADVEEILAGNIYHRHVVLGTVEPARPAALSFSVLRDGEELASTSTPEALTGELGSVLAAMAGTLAAVGAGLRAGDVVITGAVIAPLPVADGSSWSVTTDGLGWVSVSLG